MIRAAVLATTLCTVLSACATGRVVQPASEIESSVAQFRSELSNFQQAVGYLQKGEEDRISYLEIQRQAAMNIVAYQQTLWAIETGGTPGKMFVTLRNQQPLTTLPSGPSLGGASQSVSTPSLPLDKLQTVVQDLQALSKPPTQIADVKFMAGYVKSVKQDLGAAATTSSVSQKLATHP